jgi:RNA polymerase sigma-70 factor (ECF subfamily)
MLNLCRRDWLNAASGSKADFDHAAALASCARGDSEALRTLYDREAASMIGIALRIVRRKDLAEEVVHDAFLAIWRKAGQFDPVLGSGRSWIYAIVRNRALNLIRDRSREDLVEASELEALSDQSAHEDLLARLPERDQLRLCLERLDKTRRASVVMAYVGGFSHGEIAGRLGVPLGTVKAWIRRSLLVLRECMA